MTLTLDALPADRLLLEMSTWSADLGNLRHNLGRVAREADLWHVDVSDGHFAPALLFFPDLVRVVREVAATPVHVHLMVADDVLLDQVRQFAEAGADVLSIHMENGARARADAFALLGDLGVLPGVVLKVDTPVEALGELPPEVRFVTLLGTAIGVKGQGLDPQALPRLREARAVLDARGTRAVLAADGAIREATVPGLREAGADTVVMGSLAFGAADLAATAAWARALPRS